MDFPFLVNSDFWNGLGLIFSIFGGIVIIYEQGSDYLISLFSERKREELRKSAIALSYARLAGSKESMEKDSEVNKILSAYKWNFWGLVSLLLGFIFQFVGLMFS